MKYEYRREPRNDQVGKGHIVVATDANGLENVIAFCRSEVEAKRFMDDLITKTMNAAETVNDNPDTVTGEDGGQKED